MELKERYKILLESFKVLRKGRNLPIRNEDIAMVLGYNRSYFSSLLGKNGVITEEHLRDLNMHIQMLGNVTRGTSEPLYDTKESVLRMLDKSLDANTRHAAANEKNADNLTRLVELLALQFNLGETGSASEPSQEKSAVRRDPVEQTSVFVGKSEIDSNRKKKGQKKRIAS